MKILWLSHLVPYPPKGGVLQRSFNLLLELSKDNAIYLLAYNQKALLPTGQSLQAAVSALRKHCHGIEVVSLPSDRSAISKYSLILRSLFTKTPYAVNWNQCPGMTEILQRTINEFKPDLIHYDTIGLAQFFQYDGSIPQILNHHNIESAMMFRRAAKERRLLRKFYFRREAVKLAEYERRMCGLYNSNLTVSDEDRLTLESIVPGVKTEVIPNGVDISYFTPQSANGDGEALIFAGGMTWYPNLDAMLYFADDIWPLLKRERPSVRMTVIGRSPPRKLKQLSRDDPHMAVTGFVDDVRPYFRKASIYVCPIRDGGGTRLKILDALSSGLPVIATSVAAEGIKVTPGRNIIIANTPGEFVKEILRLIENKDLREQLSAEGRYLAETVYNWSIIGSKLNTLYRGFTGLG